MEISRQFPRTSYRRLEGGTSQKRHTSCRESLRRVDPVGVVQKWGALCQRRKYTCAVKGVDECIVDTLLSWCPLKDDKLPEGNAEGERPSLDTASNGVPAYCRKTHCVSSTVCCVVRRKM